MVFSGDLLKETYSKFKPEYTCWFDKSTWKYLDKYQVLCLQVQVSTKYFWISKCQVQVSTKYSRFCIKYQVSSTSTLLDPNPGSNLNHLVNTGLVVGYFFKLLPITVTHTCKLDTIWVVYISPIGNGSIRLQSPLTHYMPCEILHPVVLGSSVSSLALILKTINLFVPCTLIFWKSYQSW